MPVHEVPKPKADYDVTFDVHGRFGLKFSNDPLEMSENLQRFCRQVFAALRLSPEPLPVVQWIQLATGLVQQHQTALQTKAIFNFKNEKEGVNDGKD